MGYTTATRSGSLHSHMEHAVDVCLRKLMKKKPLNAMFRNQLGLTLKDWRALARWVAHSLVNWYQSYSDGWEHIK